MVKEEEEEADSHSHSWKKRRGGERTGDVHAFEKREERRKKEKWRKSVSVLFFLSFFPLPPLASGLVGGSERWKKRRAGAFFPKKRRSAQKFFEDIFLLLPSFSSFAFVSLLFLTARRMGGREEWKNRPDAGTTAKGREERRGGFFEGFFRESGRGAEKIPVMSPVRNGAIQEDPAERSGMHGAGGKRGNTKWARGDDSRNDEYFL